MAISLLPAQVSNVGASPPTQNKASLLTVDLPVALTPTTSNMVYGCWDCEWLNALSPGRFCFTCNILVSVKPYLTGKGKTSSRDWSAMRSLPSFDFVLVYAKYLVCKPSSVSNNNSILQVRSKGGVWLNLITLMSR